MSKRVLLIEDSDTDITIMQRVATKAGLPAQMDAVNSGEAALAYLESHPPPKLVLMDWNMPGLSGQPLLNTLKAWGKAPVCVLTTADPELDPRPQQDRIEDRYFEKPAGVSGLMALMDELKTLL